MNVLFCEKAGVPKGWDFLMAQTRNAIAAAEEHGFGRVSLVTVPGRPHGPLADEVITFFEKVRKEP